jgi:glycosyltransferase involved in cell wall biosynthesis
MKVSGFTIVRNGVKYFYPFREAILSILPICDELIVNVGNSEDNTLEVIKSIDSNKIKILNRTWDMSLRDGGKVLSIESNAALVKCSGDWCFYIQADEVLHEKYIPMVKDSMKKFLHNNKIEGLRFQYKHFYGSYDYYQDNYRNWYIREVRIIKNNRGIVSWGDAMDFKHSDGRKIKSINIKAEIFHYGWVRPPDTLMTKRIDFHKLYHSDETVKTFASSIQNYDDLGNLKKFKDTHPAVMLERVNLANWAFDAKLQEQYPNWIRKILIFLHPLVKRIRHKRF